MSIYFWQTRLNVCLMFRAASCCIDVQIHITGEAAAIRSASAKLLVGDCVIEWVSAGRLDGWQALEQCTCKQVVLILLVLALVFLASGYARAGIDDEVVVYQADFFARYRPTTALEMAHAPAPARRSTHVAPGTGQFVRELQPGGGGADDQHTALRQGVGPTIARRGRCRCGCAPGAAGGWCRARRSG